MASRAIVVWIIVSLVLAAATFAATTSRLRGRVLDESEEPIAGATVRISSEQLIGGPQDSATDDRGEFVFSLLLVGEYTVETQKVGYEPATVLATVQLDRVAAVTLRMAPLEFASEIVVTSEVPIMDPARTNSGEVYNVEYIENTTIGVNRRLGAITGQAAGVEPSWGGRGVFGATGFENAHLLDGLNVNDPSTGQAGIPVFQLNLDSVEEISVLTGGFDAEFGHATGGVVNMVTKSGGNRFSGTFDARYGDESLNEAGDHYDPDTDVFSRDVLSATLGGPILSDRLWFFVSALEDAFEVTPEGAPATTTTDAENYLGKLTWAASGSHRLTYKYQTNPIDRHYVGASPLATAEATEHRKLNGRANQVELSSVLSASLLFNLGLGFTRSDFRVLPEINDPDTPPEIDWDAYLLFSNPLFIVPRNPRDRDQYTGSLAYFLNDLAGSHEWKLGGEYQRLRERAGEGGTPGGYHLEYLNNAYYPVPWPDSDGNGLVDLALYRDFPFDTLQGGSVRSDGWGAFLQDEWHPAPDLTLRLGLRYDTMEHINAVGALVAAWDKLQPRLGIAWDVGGRSRHVIRASWGRFVHPGVTNLPLSVWGETRGSGEYWGLDALCGFFAICDRGLAAAFIGEEFVHVDGDGDEHYFYLNGITSELPAETVDTLGVGRLRAPYRDELVLAYEVQVAEQTWIELAYVQRESGDQIEDTCINNTWAWGAGDTPSLDDPSTWTDEGACTGSVRVNLEGLRREYDALVLRAASRARPWFHLRGSYTYSKTRGNNYSNPFTGFGTDLSGFPGTDFDFFPTNFVNLDGNLGADTRHFVKLNGYLTWPHDFGLAVGAWYTSAGALSVWTNCRSMLFPSGSGLAELERLGIDHAEMARYCQSPRSSTFIALEPQGSRRGEDSWQLDLQVSKGFRIQAARLTGLVAVINVFSEEAPSSFRQNPFAPTGWGAVTDHQNPRRWEVGLRVEF